MSDFKRTEAEYVQLKTDRDDLRGALDQANLRIQELATLQQQILERNSQLRKALEVVEWTPAVPTLTQSCPICFGQKTTGHASDCQIASVLGRLTVDAEG